MNMLQNIFQQPLTVFSAFDGCSCGQVALQRLGIEVKNYFSSEIDPYPIKVTQANFPNTIQIGDITKVDTSQLPKIDLMMGGSPCQGFSFASNKQLNFDDPRSKLFFDFIRLRDELRPKYVLLENVRMSKESQDIISKYMGCEPTKINSSLLSAQSRNRLYWLVMLVGEVYKPIHINQPKDKGIVMKDILEDLPFGELPQYLANHWGGEPRGNKVKSMDDPKDNCLTASMYKGQIPTFVKKPIKVGMMVEKVKVRKHEVDVPNLQKLLRGAKTSSGKTNKQIANDTDMPITKVEHWFRTDTSFAIPSDDVWYKLKDVLGMDVDSFDKQIMEFEYRDGVYESTQRVYSDYGKSPTITASNMAQFIETTLGNYGWRKLTPLECERLQTLPDNYTNHVSKSKRYKMIGNGWTVDVIAYILNHLLTQRHLKSESQLELSL